MSIIIHATGTMTREKKSFQRLKMTDDPLDDGPTTPGQSTGNLEKKNRHMKYMISLNFYGPHQQTGGAVMSIYYFVCGYHPITT